MESCGPKVLPTKKENMTLTVSRESTVKQTLTLTTIIYSSCLAAECDNVTDCLFSLCVTQAGGQVLQSSQPLAASVDVMPTWSSSCWTTCICTLHCAVLLSSRECSLPMCLKHTHIHTRTHRGIKEKYIWHSACWVWKKQKQIWWSLS